jgi:rRNA-processing protein FCF1
LETVLDAGALIEKHKAKGVLLDTNLLVLYLIGKVNPRRILNHKRTASYDLDDFKLLDFLIGRFGRLVASPHVLSQTSDLAAFDGAERSKCRSIFRTLIQGMDERYDESRLVVDDPIFSYLGLADAAIAVASQNNLLALTDDLDLHRALTRRGVDALNFNHVRQLAW